MQESRNNIENTLKAKEKEIGEGMNVLAKKAKVRRERDRRGRGGEEADPRALEQYLETEMKTAEGYVVLARGNSVIVADPLGSPQLPPRPHARTRPVTPEPSCTTPATLPYINTNQSLPAHQLCSPERACRLRRSLDSS